MCCYVVRIGQKKTNARHACGGATDMVLSINAKAVMQLPKPRPLSLSVEGYSWVIWLGVVFPLQQ